MKNILYLFIFACTARISAQEYYFPPLTGSTWETTTPQSLGWCTEKLDTLYNYLASTNTKAFIVLKNGRIVLEKYFNTFTQDSAWYWASAGKTLTALTIGIAQEEGFLKLQDATSKYLGTGWTTAPLSKENLITVRHQLTMTSGLDDGVADRDCTLPSCLTYKSDAGTRWAYHNAPYTLLDKVIEAATGSSLNTYVQSKIRLKTGMTGLYIKVDYNNVFFSTPRSMARFGLLMLNKGKWGSTPVLSDTAFFRQMVNTSQNLNLSYGYLTWLNGKPSSMVPSSQIVFPFSISPDAPPDMFAALGKNGQLINIIPSQGIVMIRMGNNPDNALVPFTYNNEVWKRLNLVVCNRTTSVKNMADTEGVIIYPNPVSSDLTLDFKKDILNGKIKLINSLGQIIKSESINGSTIRLEMSNLPSGFYSLYFENETMRFIKNIIKN
jgi:CubicO group peptidase (beta-lactamase class C family)